MDQGREAMPPRPQLGDDILQPQSSEVTQTHSPMDGSPTSLPKYGWDSLNTPKTLKITCAINNAEARMAEKNLPYPVQLVWHRKHQQGPYSSPSKHFNLKHTIPKDAPDTPAAGSSDACPSLPCASKLLSHCPARLVPLRDTLAATEPI